MSLTPSLRKLALDSYSSITCPHCGQPKSGRKSFCTKCYWALPEAERKALYKAFTSGYADAWDAAMTWLQAESDIPKAKAKPPL